MLQTLTKPQHQHKMQSIKSYLLATKSMNQRSFNKNKL